MRSFEDSSGEMIVVTAKQAFLRYETYNGEDIVLACGEKVQREPEDDWESLTVRAIIILIRVLRTPVGISVRAREAGAWIHPNREQ